MTLLDHMGCQWENRPFGERDMFTYGPIEPVPIWDIGLLKELRVKTCFAIFASHNGADTNFLFFIISNLLILFILNLYFGLDKLCFGSNGSQTQCYTGPEKEGQYTLKKKGEVRVYLDTAYCRKLKTEN